MVIQSIAKHYTKFHQNINGLPHVITSNMEHDSVKLVLQELANDNLLGKVIF